MFGFDPALLLDADGVPFVDAMVLSHPEQVERLRAACPPAAPTAVLAGDPCYDRLLSERPLRERFRRTLGVHPGQQLLLLNSTWNPNSLFGDGGPVDLLPLLLPRLRAELPADEYRVAAVLHPNIWHGHGPGQIRLWLDAAQRAGLTLIDPVHDWRQALLAADAVLGDFGSVSYYAAALGTPVLLGAASLDTLGPDSPVADFVRKAPQLDPYTALLPQLDRLQDEHRPLPGPAALTSSDPGRSAGLLRSLCYRLIGLTEPSAPARLDRLPLPPYQPPLRTAPLRVCTRVLRQGVVELHRTVSPEYEPDGPGDGHLAVHESTLDREVLELADLVYRYGAPDDPRLGPPADWAAEILDRFPGCSLAAYVTGPHSCVARHRNGLLVELSTQNGGADPAAWASALLARPTLAPLTVRTGSTTHRIRVTDLRR
ncbi:hypothetical protein GCM10009664_50760 [Kitasatospora gansuensis]